MSTFGSQLPQASSLNQTDELLITQYVNGQPFTRRLLASLAYPVLNLKIQTANYTLQASDWSQTWIEFNSASALVLTIPADSTINFPIGTNILVSRYGAGTVTIAGAGGVNIRASSSLTLRAQYSMGGIIKRAANEWYFTGDQT